MSDGHAYPDSGFYALLSEMVEAEEKMRRDKLEREYFLNPKEKAELKNTQPKSSEPQAKAPARKDDRAR